MPVEPSPTAQQVTEVKILYQNKVFDLVYVDTQK